MSNTYLNVYRGTHGMGVVISIRYQKDRVIFDFGAPFSPLSEIYDGEVKPRIQNRVKDALLLGRIPAIPGVFSRKDLCGLSILPQEDSDLNTAVFISHLHLDHMSEIDKIAPDIPVYIHSEGLKMQELIDKMENNTIYRSYSPFEYERPITIGQITVTPYFSDHPCAGAASFLIETPDQTIVYSGDIRYHGNQREKAFQVMEDLGKSKDIDLLLIDSTCTSPLEFDRDGDFQKFSVPSKDYLFDSISEQDIYDDVYRSLKDFDGLGIFNQYPRDVNMLRSMHHLGEKLGRTTVFEPYYANILYNLTGIRPNVIFPAIQNAPEYFDTVKQFTNIILIDEIQKAPEKFLLQNSYQNITSLIDLDSIPGVYFHLLGEPLVKDTKEYKIMLNIINKLYWKFSTYINLYSFSHSYPNHLSYVIEKLNPKYVVAVHSKNPEKLNPVNSTQLFPEEGIEYRLDDGNIIKE